MRVLIVSVTTGFGHHSTAAALAELLRAKGAEAVVVDMYEYCSNFAYHAMDKGYLFTTKHLRRLFGRSYKTMDRNRAMRRLSSFITGNPIFCRQFARIFHGFQPDLVLTTHVFSAYVLSELKRQQLITMPTVGVITDYCIHPYWEDYAWLDYIVTASELLTPAALEKGIPEEKLLPYGLPVRKKFLSRMTKQSARNSLGLKDVSTVLVMGGSMGYGKMADTVRQILDSRKVGQVVCICGNNTRLLKELRALKEPELRVYGFVTNVEQFMDAADCIVTKPGGLTVTELLVKQLPPVLTDPIPGHEELNARFLVENGAAVCADESLPVAAALEELFSEPERLGRMRDALGRLAHPDAAERICDKVLELAGEKTAAASKK